jgi:uncharacterized protein (TIGR03067 family)
MTGRILCVVAIALLAFGGALIGGDGKDTNESALKKMQGKWKFTAHVMGDKAAPPEQLEKMTITFTGDKFSVRIGDKVVQAGTNTLDPSKKPGHVDSMVLEGKGKGGTMLGIFEMKGDKMKVCFDPEGKSRPSSFIAKEGQFSATIQRDK